MSEELAKREHDLLPIWQPDGSVAMPITREIIGPDAPIEALARGIEEIDLFLSNFRDVRSTFEGWVKERAKLEATKTLTIPVSEHAVARRSDQGPRPKAIEVRGVAEKRVYPGARLRAQLLEWVREGKISQAAADRACRESTEYTPLLTGIDAIAKAHPDLAPYLKAMEELQPAKQYVNLT